MVAIYNIDINKLAQLVLPTFLRKPILSALLKAVVSPLHMINRMFAAHRIETNYRLQHTSQICYLQAALNDEFDSQYRRIRILDAPRYEPIIFYPQNDNKPVLFYGRDQQKPVVFYSRALISAIGIDFIIEVPAAIIKNKPDEVRFLSLIDYYKLASKRYELNTF